MGFVRCPLAHIFCCHIAFRKKLLNLKIPSNLFNIVCRKLILYYLILPTLPALTNVNYECRAQMRRLWDIENVRAQLFLLAREKCRWKYY